jgi:hypothetical protein
LVNWELKFIFFTFYEIILVSWLEFDGLTPVDSNNFFLIFILFFYQFNHLMLVLLGIGLHKFYLFIYFIYGYHGFMIRVAGFVVWFEDFCYFFLILSFWYWIEWKLRFIFYFGLHSMRLFWSRDSNPKFSWLIYVFFVLIFYLRFFYFII